MGYTDNLLAGSFTERTRMIKGLLDLQQAERLAEQSQQRETQAALDNARRQLAELRAEYDRLAEELESALAELRTAGARGATGAEVAV